MHQRAGLPEDVSGNTINARRLRTADGIVLKFGTEMERVRTHIVCKAHHSALRGSTAIDENVKPVRTRAHRMQTCSHFAQLQEQPTSILCEKLNTLLQGVAELWLKIVQLCCPVELHGRG